MAIFDSYESMQILEALGETLYMTGVSLLFAVIIGIIMGIILFITQDIGLYPNKIIHTILDWLINILRAIPFIILLILVMPLAKILTGSILGASAALPSLILSSAPFYARMSMIALNEVDKGVIEAAKAMGANNITVIFKFLLPEAKSALVSGIALMAISLIGYTAMAGAIGAGGLGDLAYTYGFTRQNYLILYLATALVVVIVFIIQFIGDYLVKRIDKR